MVNDAIELTSAERIADACQRPRTDSDSAFTLPDAGLAPSRCRFRPLDSFNESFPTPLMPAYVTNNIGRLQSFSKALWASEPSVALIAELRLRGCRLRLMTTHVSP